MAADRTCAQCENSLAGRRANARFCSDNCRLKAHRGEVGRIEDVPSLFVINKPTRDMLVGDDWLNPQHEGDPEKVRQAFRAFIEDQAKRHA